MSKILDLRQKRSELWDKAKAFLDNASRSEDGTLSAEDLSTYEKMEADIDSLGREISAMERREQLDAKMMEISSSLFNKAMTPGNHSTPSISSVKGKADTTCPSSAPTTYCLR